MLSGEFSADTPKMPIPPGARLPLVALLGAATMLPVGFLPQQAATAVAGLMHAAAMVVAAVLLLRAARREEGVMRRPRLLLAASLVATGLGAVIAVGYTVALGSVPVPSVVDPVSMLWVPLATTAFWLVPVRADSPVSTARVLADAAVASTSLLFVAWVTVIGPVAASGRWSLWGQAVEITYPVLDVFVVIIVLSVLGRVRADLRPFMNCVALGLLLVALSDARAAYVLADHGSVPFGWQDATLQAALFAFVYASLVRRTPVMTERGVGSEIDRLLPVVPVLLAVATGLWRVFVDGVMDLDDCLVAALMIVTVMLRQVLYIRELTAIAEKHRLTATQDGLTGLASRKAFLARLAEHLGTPGAGGAAVLLADLNGFKEINDTLGHEVGDKALRNFAVGVSAAAGAHLCSRLGGDEFAVLVVADDAEGETRALADQVQSLRMTAGAGLSMSCSMGIAVVQAGDRPADVLRRADLAMYSAKRRHDRRVAVFEHAMAEASDRRSLLSAALDGAVARGEMALYYQPVVRPGDGRLTGAEALLRWTHPVLGSVPPDEFIPLAEDTGCISAIGSWVLETAIAQVARWEAEGRYLPRIYVNTAASQFTGSLADEVCSMLARHHVGPHRLTLEITETQLPGLAVNASMQQLRRNGVQIALDDFGSGYSSLARISRLPVDVLKIDRQLIHDLDAPSGRPVLDAIVGLARALGVETVAEGIENSSQAAEVAAAGVDFAQGYLFGRPVPTSEIADRLPCVPGLPTLPSQRPDVVAPLEIVD
jgi:diguanylate cyclase (GGDEF)-like protein